MLPGVVFWKKVFNLFYAQGVYYGDEISVRPFSYLILRPPPTSVYARPLSALEIEDNRLAREKLWLIFP